MTPHSVVDMRITGRVQGVGFRWFVYRNAQRLGLGGYVRNTDDGDVIVRAGGDRTAIEQLIAEMRRGPSSAVVGEVVVEWHITTEEYTRFEIR